MDKTLLKANILGGMDAYLVELGDENLLERWYMFGVPEDCDEEMLMEIAEDESEFLRISNLWNNLIREEIWK